jgi:hypothetical protein
MNIGRRILFGEIIAAGVWFLSLAGLLFCFFTYQIIGRFFYLPFFWLASWPQAILSLFLPKKLPEWYSIYAWPIGCAVSLTGWLLIGIVAISLFHFIARRCGKRLSRHDEVS